MMGSSKSKPSLVHNKLLPLKSVWHRLWGPDALIECKDRNRHDGLWCNSPDKTSTEQCVSSQFSSCPCFTRRSRPPSLSLCPHGIPSGQRKTRRACCAILRLYFSIRRWRLTCCFPGEKKKQWQKRISARENFLWEGTQSQEAMKSVKPEHPLTRALQYIQKLPFFIPYRLFSISCTDLQCASRLDHFSDNMLKRRWLICMV